MRIIKKKVLFIYQTIITKTNKSSDIPTIMMSSADSNFLFRWAESVNVIDDGPAFFFI